MKDWLESFVRDPSFLDRYPYYAAALARMRPVADPSVQRMAISLHDGRFYLHVNVDAFLHEPQYLRGVLLHEVHHLVLGHLTHPKFAEVSEPELMDLAVEMSANEHIEEPLPSPITWRAYSAAGIRAGQSTMERYEKLVEASRANGARPRPDHGAGGSSAERVDDHRFLRRGHTMPGGLTQTRALVSDVLASTPPSPGDDGLPTQPRWAGQTPGRLLEELGAPLREPSSYVDWKTAMRMFVARARAPVHSYARPSRRFPERIGIIPGRTYVPRALTRPRVLVAVDTSLSMTRTELDEVARQLGKLADHAVLTVAECDVEITRTYAFEGSLPSVAGRGGTDLRPVFDPQLLGRLKTDGVVYFTDGDGPFPEEPATVPTLWVLTKPEVFRCPWGQRAWLGRGPRRVALPPAPLAPKRRRAR